MHRANSRNKKPQVWDAIPDDGSWISLVEIGKVVGSSPAAVGRAINLIKDRVARSTHDCTEKGIKQVRRLPQFCRPPYNQNLR